jgi:hypothetical protein
MPIPPFYFETSEVFQQTIDVIQQLSNQQYAGTLHLLEGKSIGEHVRHIISFYDCLISASNGGMLSYDLRSRDTLTAQSTQLAIAELNRILTELQHLPDVSFQLQGRCIESYNHSTHLEREMLYLLEHSIHHLALIKLVMISLNWPIQFPEHFGVAYSTPKNGQPQPLCA